jgi:hypothetical protein|tara:strand:- start:15 stop:431 length:417 start_codon:yes stop_codon:yes gene_type:complete
MKKVEDKLNEILDIAEKDVVPVESKPVIPRPKEQEDITNDYKYSRENLYNLVERGQDAIDGILTLAKETEHPRTYEVAGQLIKNVGEVTEKLLQLQEKMKKLGEETKKVPNKVENNLFVGSTAELQKLIKKNGKDVPR